MKEQNESLFFVGVVSLVAGVAIIPTEMFGWGLIFWGSFFTFTSVFFEHKR